MNIEVMLDAHATIGESPTWVAQETSLYWIDVKKPALYRLEVTTGRQRSWPMSADIGGFALLESRKGALVALRTGLYRLDFSSSALALVAPAPFDPNAFRFNEGTCDNQGRFWIGVMFDPLVKTSTKEEASLHSFRFAEGLRREADVSELHNGMAWTPDGRAFYISHSQKREIYRYAFDPAAGKITDRCLFARVEEGQGVPDGAAVDADGGYWCALHGGGRVRRYLANGAIDRDVILPVSQPTMCAFGGESLEHLYVTSATDGLSPERREREPLAGALLRLETGMRGIARPIEAR